MEMFNINSITVPINNLNISYNECGLEKSHI